MLETLVRAQAIQVRIGLQKYHPRRALLVCSLQQIESFVSFTQRGIDSGKTVGCYVALLRKCAQLFQNPVYLVPVARPGMCLG